MNISIPMWVFLAVSIIAAVAVTAAYFKGYLTGYKDGLNHEIEDASNIFKASLDVVCKDREKLMAQACVSSGKCRRTPEEYDDILFKKMLEMENERRHPECDPADCNDCDPKDCVCGEDSTQAVTESNIEAAESRPSTTQIENHAKALERCANTKKAAQKSIGMTDDEIEAVNGSLD